jgi:HAD superfamily hydrolase (TIGR01509 family)
MCTVQAMAAPLELVIFDCDGVLVDSERLGVPIDVAILAEFGIQMTEAEVIERFVGRSAVVMRDAIEAHLGHPLSDERQARYERIYLDAYEAELTPVDGIVQALDEISQPTCVASSSEPAGLRRKLELTGLLARFDGRIFSAVEVANGKPAPDLFLHAARWMGADPAGCVVVEDSRHGVEAARAAGMDAFAYSGAVTPAKALEGPRTTVFTEMRRLPELVAARARA